MAGVKNTDPVVVFERGRRGMKTLVKALSSDRQEVQLAAARIVEQAAKQLPDAIDEELRRTGTEARSGAAIKRRRQGMR